jgi:lipopolysaccharide/colanic/teichoic acid biosynthesis glycosyltransferase
VILPSALTGHGLTLVWFVLTRFPYDRLALAAGFLLHIVWLYALYVYAERRVRRRIAVVPYGNVGHLAEIDGVDWLMLNRARLHDARACHAIVADFTADLPDEWEAFLADAALAGRIVYQVKQLSESLTGRVELEHLSENSFGSLVPARGYFHLKGLLDFLAALVALPLALPIMAVCAIAIRLDSEGPVLFRQTRVGHAGRRITVYKFRTMREVEAADERLAAITGADDERITRVGRTLRYLRLDELPQMFNILKWQMSWIGPRPEAEVLSIWYTSEIPFYRYRHVVKPGISGWGQPGPCRGGRRSPPQAPVRLLLHQIFLALARPPDPAPDDQDDAHRLGRALGAVSRIVANTGSTPSATIAIMAPGASAQPVRPIRY